MKWIHLSLGVFFLLCGCASRPYSEPMSDKASLQYQFAYDAFVRGNLIPALGAALKAIELSPNSSDARNLLGLIYFRQTKYAEAEEQIKQAVLLDPKLSEGWNNLGTLYFEQKRYSEAHKALEKALENPLYLYPERIYNNLGLVEEALGNKKAAIDDYDQAINLQRQFYLPFQNLGKLHYETGNYSKATGLLEEAAKLCQECSEPRYYLGMALLKANKTQDALKAFKQGAKADPQSYYSQLCQKYLVKE